MEREELDCQEEPENLDNMEISFNNEKQLTVNPNLNPNSKLEVSQGEHMESMATEISIDIIENTSPRSIRLSKLVEMESKCLANTIIFKNNPSLCKSETESEITAGQGGVKCALRAHLKKKESNGHKM